MHGAANAQCLGKSGLTTIGYLPCKARTMGLGFMCKRRLCYQKEGMVSNSRTSSSVKSLPKSCSSPSELTLWYPSKGLRIGGMGTTHTAVSITLGYLSCIRISAKPWWKCQEVTQTSSTFSASTEASKCLHHGWPGFVFHFCGPSLPKAA